MQTIKNYQAYPRYDATNRKIKRSMINEFNSLTIKLAELEQLFANYVFRPSCNYEVEYKSFLEAYQRKIDEINRISRPRYIILNPTYFRDAYAPVNNIKILSNIHDIHNLIRRLFS